MSTALLVIDMQNGFCDAEGTMPRAGFGLPRIDEVIAETAALLGAARTAGLPVVYTRHGYRADMLDRPARLRVPAELRPLVRGSWDTAIVDRLAPGPEDRIVDKNRYDAFLYTDLVLVLRAIGATRLLVSGVVTNACVESTVRSAEQRDFEVLVAADCTCAPEPMHEASLVSMAYAFATVGPWRRLLADLTP
jgi:ureidoacrylate peracid hydrolase